MTGDDQHSGQALLVCPAGDKAISWASASSAGNLNLAAEDAMPNADDTGYQYFTFTESQNPEPYSTDIAVTCAAVS